MSSQSRKAVEWIKAAPPGTIRTQKQAALIYGVTQPSISAALARYRPDPVRAEREACAAIARAQGAQGVADAILARSGGAA